MISLWAPAEPVDMTVDVSQLLKDYKGNELRGDNKYKGKRVRIIGIGVPSARYGEEVMAWVRPRPGATLDGYELTRFCTGTIATYKIPRYWRMVTEFPMTVTGKIQKFKMREISIEELGLAAVAKAKTA